MALIRPVVLVFQEFANPTVTPATPDLNCLIAGPSYFIQDYPADKADIQVDNYGDLESAAPYTLPTGDVVVLTDAPNNVVGALLDAASVVVTFDNAHVRIVEAANGTTSSSTPNHMTAPVDYTTGANLAKAGDRLILTDGSSVTAARTISSVTVAAGPITTFVFTQDVPASWTHAAGSIDYRVERTLSDQPVDGSFVVISDNAITVEGAVTLTANSVAKSVTFANVYVSYRSLRQDLQDLHTIENEADAIATLGRIDARNPLALAVSTALQNTQTPIQAYAVASNDVVGYTLCRDAISSRADVYAIVPLTTDTAVLALWKAHCEAVALPDESKGRPQRFRVVLGSGELPVTKVVVDDQTLGKTEQTGSALSPVKQFTLTGQTLTALTSGFAIPGDKLIISLDANGVTRDGTYTIAQVISNTILEVDEVIPAAASANASIVIKDSTLVTTKLAITAVTPVVSAALDALYLQLRDNSGSFVSSGVIPGDLLEMPVDPTQTSYTSKVDFVIATVTSENRVQIVNNGTSTSSVANELPHGIVRGSTVAVPSTFTLNYRVVRTLDKAGQVSELVALAQSLKSRRVVMVWPDSVKLPDITAKQPGYYLAAVVGGMTAGLPSHQGFTNIGVAGISQIYNSNTYFTDDELTDLSQGGWYVMAQNTPTSLPYCLHQLTTDVSTLESGEYSVVKNFDFVSIFLSDILSEFLGTYNITDELLGFIRTGLQTGIQTLRLRRFSKIGAPLLGGTVVEVARSLISADRVVANVTVDLPKPLNTIELHLVG